MYKKHKKHMCIYIYINQTHIKNIKTHIIHKTQQQQTKTYIYIYIYIYT